MTTAGSFTYVYKDKFKSNVSPKNSSALLDNEIDRTIILGTHANNTVKATIYDQARLFITHE